MKLPSPSPFFKTKCPSPRKSGSSHEEPLPSAFGHVMSLDLGPMIRVIQKVLGARTSLCKSWELYTMSRRVTAGNWHPSTNPQTLHVWYRIYIYIHSISIYIYMPTLIPDQPPQCMQYTTYTSGVSGAFSSTRWTGQRGGRTHPIPEDSWHGVIYELLGGDLPSSI